MSSHKACFLTEALDIWCAQLLWYKSSDGQGFRFQRVDVRKRQPCWRCMRWDRYYEGFWQFLCIVSSSLRFRQCLETSHEQTVFQGRTSASAWLATFSPASLQETRHPLASIFDTHLNSQTSNPNPQDPKTTTSIPHPWFVVPDPSP